MACPLPCLFKNIYRVFVIYLKIENNLISVSDSVYWLTDNETLWMCMMHDDDWWWPDEAGQYAMAKNNIEYSSVPSWWTFNVSLQYLIIHYIGLHAFTVLAQTFTLTFTQTESVDPTSKDEKYNSWLQFDRSFLFWGFHGAGFLCIDLFIWN